MVFAQGTSSQSAPSGIQPSDNVTGTSQDGKATVPSQTPSAASSTPSTPNQALPGNANPGTAAAKDGRANGQAVRPDQSSGSASGGAAGSTSNTAPRANDDASTNPNRTRDANTAAGRGEAVPWFWVAFGIIVGVVLIGALMSRSRVVDTMEPSDPGLRTRRDDQIRRAG
jgi:hypothetical protein